MRYLIAFLLMSFTITANAQTYLVFDFTNEVRVVISNESCLVNGLKGNRAAVQRIDGKYKRGCWNYLDNNKLVRIDWENPINKDDFAIIRLSDFHPEEN